MVLICYWHRLIDSLTFLSSPSWTPSSPNHCIPLCLPVFFPYIISIAHRYTSSPLLSVFIIVIASSVLLFIIVKGISFHCHRFSFPRLFTSLQHIIHTTRIKKKDAPFFSLIKQIQKMIKTFLKLRHFQRFSKNLSI